MDRDGLADGMQAGRDRPPTAHSDHSGIRISRPTPLASAPRCPLHPDTASTPSQECVGLRSLSWAGMSESPLSPGAGTRSHPGGVPDLPELPAGVPGHPRWAPWTAPAALLISLTLTLFVGVLLGVVVVVAGSTVSAHQSTVDIVGTFLQDVALVGTAVVFARLAGGRWRPRDFGLRPTRLGAAVGWATLGLVTSLVFTAAFSAALHNHQKEQVLHQLGADREGPARYFVALLVCVVAPMAEEFFFRGYFFTALRGWRGTVPAVLLTGLTFGAVHVGSAPLVYLVPLAVLGMILCLVYLRTGSLYPCVGLHMVNNCLAFGVSEGWGWQIPILILVSGLLVGVTAFAVTRWTPLRGPTAAPAV